MSISFSQLSTILKKQKKKTGKKGKGITGLPTFSNADPRFKQKLRIPNNKKDEDEGTARATRGEIKIPCGGVNQPDCPTPCAKPPCYFKPPEQPEPCPWGVNIEGDCVMPDRLFEPEDWTGEVFIPEPTSGKPYTYTKQEEPEPEPPDCPWGVTRSGACIEVPDPEEEDAPKGNDLFDPWKYRGITNTYSLYYQDK